MENDEDSDSETEQTKFFCLSCDPDKLKGFNKKQYLMNHVKRASHALKAGSADHASAKRKASTDAYEASDKGKARKAAYEASEQRKDGKAAYEASEKRKNGKAAYEASEKRKDEKVAYEASEKRIAGKAAYEESGKRKAVKGRYDASHKGRNSKSARLSAASSEVKRIVSQRDNQRRLNFKRSQQDSFDPSQRVADGTQDDVDDALERYYASTNVAMLLDDDPDAIIRNIKTFCLIEPDKKDELRRQWLTGKMAHGAPLPGCASCGIQCERLRYESVMVNELPPYFEFDASSQQQFDELAKGCRF